MNSLILKRVIDEAHYMIDNENTIREIAKIFNVSKSTVHKDLSERLIEVDKNLYEKVNKILKYHIEIRHLRGGESTKKRYIKNNNSMI